MEVGCLEGRTRLVMLDLHTYTLYCVCVITSAEVDEVEGSSLSGCNLRVAAEVNAIWEQQLK